MRPVVVLMGTSGVEATARTLEQHIGAAMPLMVLSPREGVERSTVGRISPLAGAHHCTL